MPSWRSACVTAFSYVSCCDSFQYRKQVHILQRDLSTFRPRRLFLCTRHQQKENTRLLVQGIISSLFEKRFTQYFVFFRYSACVRDPLSLRSAQQFSLRCTPRYSSRTVIITSFLVSRLSLLGVEEMALYVKASRRLASRRPFASRI